MALKPEVIDQVIEALHQETTLARAATRAGISERKLYRILKHPEFMQRYRDVRRETMSQAMAHVQRYAVLAVHTLGAALRDGESSTPSRIQAARAMLRLGHDSLEYQDLDVRLTQLEQRLERYKRDLDFMRGPTSQDTATAIVAESVGAAEPGDLAPPADSGTP